MSNIARFTVHSAKGDAINRAYTLKALDAIERQLAREVGGFARYEVHGGWYDPDNEEVVTEDGYSWEIFAPVHQEQNIKVFAHKVQDLLEQQAVIVTSAPLYHFDMEVA